MASAQDRLGAKLGPRLVKLITQAIVHTHGQLLHVRHKLAMMIFHAISDEISDEVDVTLGPFLAMLHDAVPEDHPAYPSVHFMHTVSGQLKALAGTGLQITGLLGSVSSIVNNGLAPFVYNIISSSPGLLPDQATIVQAYAAGLISQGEASGDLRSLGIQTGWADYMLSLGFTYPAVADGLEMLRRGLITSDTFAQWGANNGIPEVVVAYYLALKDSPVSPADAALAVLRGNITAEEGNTIAVENGITPDSFQILLDNTGEPPGLEQLLEAYRRGFIDEATLRRGILQSRYRNEWIPMLEQLRYSPISVADAVNAVVQDQMNATDAEAIAEQNGLEPGQLAVLIATAGEPLSRTEMEQLYNRGLVTQDQVDQALRESRLKNKYVNLAFQLSSKILPLYTVQQLVKNGTISHATAIQQVMEDGYSKEIATAIASSGSTEKLTPQQGLAVSAIGTLYEDNLIAGPTVTEVITGLGYTEAEATFALEAYEFRREARILNTSVGAIRGKYLGRHITESEASGFLDQMGIPATQRDQLLQLWSVEYGASTRTLTPAQIVKALNGGLIEQADALSRLEALGYNETDATLLIQGA